MMGKQLWLEMNQDDEPSFLPENNLLYHDEELVTMKMRSTMIYRVDKTRMMTPIDPIM
jgi:hypothetical protein